MGANWPGSEKARERKGQGAKVPGSELARVLLADALRGANWPGSEKARYRKRMHGNWKGRRFLIFFRFLGFIGFNVRRVEDLTQHYEPKNTRGISHT